MDTIEILVNKQMDGYVFALLPNFRKLIKETFPGAHPANQIFVRYDTNGDFGGQYDRIQQMVFPALLGLVEKKDIEKIGEIKFVDTQTGAILRTLSPAA